MPEPRAGLKIGRGQPRSTRASRSFSPFPVAPRAGNVPFVPRLGRRASAGRCGDRPCRRLNRLGLLGDGQRARQEAQPESRRALRPHSAPELLPCPASLPHDSGVGAAGGSRGLFSDLPPNGGSRLLAPGGDLYVRQNTTRSAGLGGGHLDYNFYGRECCR
jgi:hypothetical protein